MNVHLFLRKICQYMCHWFLTKGFMQRSPESRREVVDKRKLNVVLESHYVLKETVPAGAGFLEHESVPETFFFSLSLSFLETPEAGLVLPFIAVRGVVYGRNCSILWLLHENCGITSCLGRVEGIPMQDMRSFREFKIVQG